MYRNCDEQFYIWSNYTEQHKASSYRTKCIANSSLIHYHSQISLDMFVLFDLKQSVHSNGSILRNGKFSIHFWKEGWTSTNCIDRL